MDDANTRVPYELARTCSNVDTDSTANDQPGPGRFVDNCLVYAGRRLELFLGKATVKMRKDRVSVVNQTLEQHPQGVSVLALHHANAHLHSIARQGGHACSVTDPDSTSSNLTGPGRAVDNFYLYAGRHLELLLSKVSMIIGKGPVVTAKRIRQRHVEMTAAKTWHVENCRCYDCQFLHDFGPDSDRHVAKSPEKLRRLNRKINRDCRRLVEYINHEEYSTQSQAIESILDLSVWDGDLRAILRANGASKAVSSVVEVYENFRFHDRSAEEMLLNTSRKALVSLDDVKFNVLVKNFISAVDVKDDWEMVEAAWNESGISEYLWRPNHAFIIMRILRRVASSDAGFLFVMEDVLHSVIQSPGYFEWEECEAILSRYEYSFTSFMTIMGEKPFNLFDWLFQNIHKMPGLFKVHGLQDLQGDISQMDTHAFWRFHEALGVVEQEIRRGNDGELSMDHLKGKYTYESLQPLLGDLACPLVRIVRELVRKDNGFYNRIPDEEERCLYKGIVCYTDAAYDSALQRRAWRYIEYFVTLDAYRFRMMLDALQKKALGCTSRYLDIEKAKKKFRFRGLDSSETKTSRYFRHRDADNTRHYHDLLRSCGCPVKTSNLETLEFPEKWTFEVEIKRGESFQSAGHHPLPATSDGSGTREYLAKISIPEFICRDAVCGLQEIMTVIADGTKPDDLLVEVWCSHRRFLLVPETITIPVLRYNLETYAGFLAVDTESLFSTGPFSWKPGRGEDDGDIWGIYPFRARIVRMEDVVAGGHLDGSNEGLVYYCCKPVRCADSDSELRSSDGIW